MFVIRGGNFMSDQRRLAAIHADITRRYFLGLGVVGLGTLPLWSEEIAASPHLADLLASLEYLTKDEDFRTIGRGDPKPHTLPAEKLRAVGLARDTWQLEVEADPESDAEVESPMTIAGGNALDWQGLMGLADKHAVRFLKVMSCTNVRVPFGMGLWEGVPLRELLWLAKPKSNVRRVFYYGYHNDDLAQRFQSSLPVGRILEDPPGEHPVILCYKLNNEWLSPDRGGPVRMIVPEAYGNKSVKWLQHIVFTNNYKANDTYALKNNDTVSSLKTCARFINAPKSVEKGDAVPITGLAQVGMSGLREVQYWLQSRDNAWREDDPYFTKAPWQTAEMLPPPEHWGGGLKDGKLPAVPRQIDPATGKPLTWPLRYTIVHWAALLRNVPPGKYDLRCRTIDANGIAQPMPRPFLKSGKNDIQKEILTVQG